MMLHSCFQKKSHYRLDLLPIKTEKCLKKEGKVQKEVFTWTPTGTGYPGDAGAASQQHPFGPGPRLDLLPEWWKVQKRKSNQKKTPRWNWLNTFKQLNEKFSSDLLYLIHCTRSIITLTSLFIWSWAFFCSFSISSTLTMAVFFSAEEYLHMPDRHHQKWAHLVMLAVTWVTVPVVLITWLKGNFSHISGHVTVW